VSVSSWPDNFLTLADWNALPEDDHHRVEVVEGVLVVSPRPKPFHQRAGRRLCNSLELQLADGLCVEQEVDVVIEETPLTVRSPDVVVVPRGVFRENPPRFQAADVRLAVEVLSEGSRRTDRVMKLAEYAEAGIPRYWIVDLGAPVSMITYCLIEGAYESFGEHTGRVTLDVDGTPVRLDLDRLVDLD
jgi:Uma2 family endonuclease